MEAYLPDLEDRRWRRGADRHHGDGALHRGGRQEVVPEPRGVDGELGGADGAGAARQPDGHAEQRPQAPQGSRAPRTSAAPRGRAAPSSVAAAAA